MKQRHWRLIMIAAGISFLFFCAPGKPDPAREKAFLEKMIRDSIAWAVAKDRPLLESLITHEEDLFMFNPRGFTSGWKEFEKNFEFWMDPRFTATGLDIRDLRITLARTGEAAWFSAVLDDLCEWDGTFVGWKDTRWTGVMEKRDGKWVIVQMHFSFEALKN